LGSQAVTIPVGSDVTFVEYEFDPPIVVPSGTEAILVEVFQDMTGVSFFIGGTAGQTAEPWLKSTQCGVADYTNPSGIGFPTAHFYITVTGTIVLSVNDQLLSQVSVFPNPATDVINVNVPSNVEITGVALFDIL